MVSYTCVCIKSAGWGDNAILHMAFPITVAGSSCMVVHLPSALYRKFSLNNYKENFAPCSTPPPPLWCISPSPIIPSTTNSSACEMRTAKAGFKRLRLPMTMHRKLWI